jgi:hypothetical protein
VGKVLVVSVGAEGEPVKQQRGGVGGSGAESGVEGPICVVFEGDVREAVEQVGRKGGLKGSKNTLKLMSRVRWTRQQAGAAKILEATFIRKRKNHAEGTG